MIFFFFDVFHGDGNDQVVKQGHIDLLPTVVGIFGKKKTRLERLLGYKS